MKKHVRHRLDPRRLKDYIAHRRILLFWTVAALSLTVPWMLAGAGSLLTVFTRGEELDDCKVLSVHDGDTMTVRCGQRSDSPRKIKVRLYCIDTPEMGQKPWGRRARDYLRAITPERVTVLARDRDRYGRLVGEVWGDGMNLNLEMVRAGKAAVYRRYCGHAAYPQAERVVQSERVGIWGQPGLHQQPWSWRRAKN